MEIMTTPSADSSDHIPLLETTLRPHQIEAVAMIEKFNGRCLIADQPGVGKTIQSLAYAFKHRLFPAVVVCPATLKYNWLHEIWTHFPERKTVDTTHILSGMKPRSMLVGEADPLYGKIYIMNYDILSGWLPALQALHPKILIVDESAAVKTWDTVRTKCLLKLAHYCDKFLALTGTPIMNNPFEIYPTLYMIFQGNVMSMSEFRNRYSYYVEQRFGRRRVWTYQGPKNLGELNKLLRDRCMIRRKTSEVLDLPPYTRITEIYQMTASQAKEYKRMNENFADWLFEHYPDRQIPNDERLAIMVRAGYIKREVAKWKLKAIIDWIDVFLENSDEALLVFAIQHYVINGISDHFKKKKVPQVVITGNTKLEDRQAAVNAIQTGSARLFVGQIHACGTGLTMTKASHSLFAELDFVPSNHIQAEARNYRIGSDKPVFWHYFITEETIEEHVAGVLLQKQNTFNEMIDGNKKNNEVFRLLAADAKKWGFAQAQKDEWTGELPDMPMEFND